MNDLVTMAGSPPPPRPTRLDDEAKARIARGLADELVSLGLLEDGTVEEYAADIAAMAEPHMDGYALTRKLEEWRFGWEGSMEIAEVLDAWAHLHAEAIEAEQKGWAERHGIRPPLPDGAAVMAKVGLERRPGVIRGVYEHGAAKYRVRDAAEPETTTRSWIVPFEDVEPIAAGAPA